MSVQEVFNGKVGGGNNTIKSLSYESFDAQSTYTVKTSGFNTRTLTTKEFKGFHPCININGISNTEQPYQFIKPSCSINSCNNDFFMIYYFRPDNTSEPIFVSIDTGTLSKSLPI